MRERLERMLGQTARAIWILTFHAACGRMLRREAERLGYRSTFTIYDDQDQVRLVKACLEELGQGPEALLAARHPCADLAREERARLARRTTPRASRRSGIRPSPRRTSSTSGGCTPRTRSTSTTCSCSPCRCFERFPEALERWRKAFRYVLVDEYQDTNHAQYRLLQLLGGEHGNVCAVGDQDQSIYGFRGADIRNILEFEHDFPGTRGRHARAELPLDEQHPPRRELADRAEPRAQAEAALLGPRRGRSRAGDRGRGRARRGALRRRRDRLAHRRRLLRRARSRSSTGRTRSRACSRTCSCARTCRTRSSAGRGSTSARRSATRTAYLSVLANPQDATSLLRIANRPRRGIGDTSIQRLVDPRRGDRAHALRGAGRSGGGRRRPRRRCRAVRSFHATDGVAHGARAGAPRDELLERVLEKTGTLDALEAERTIEARGRIENLQELVGVAREYRRAGGGAVARRLPPGHLARLRPGHDPRRARARHADDAAQREGSRVPRRLHDRDGGGDLPALALDRGAGRRGGAAPLLRRHDARDGASDADAHARALALRAPRTTTSPSRFLDELPHEVERDRLRPASWSGYGSPRRRRDRAARRASPSPPATPSGTGRSARGSSPGSSRAESSRSASRRTARNGG